MWDEGQGLWCVGQDTRHGMGSTRHRAGDVGHGTVAAACGTGDTRLRTGDVGHGARDTAGQGVGHGCRMGTWDVGCGAWDMTQMQDADTGCGTQDADVGHGTRPHPVSPPEPPTMSPQVPVQRPRRHVQRAGRDRLPLPEQHRERALPRRPRRAPRLLPPPGRPPCPPPGHPAAPCLRWPCTHGPTPVSLHPRPQALVPLTPTHLCPCVPVLMSQVSPRTRGPQTCVAVVPTPRSPSPPIHTCPCATSCVLVFTSQVSPHGLGPHSCVPIVLMPWFPHPPLTSVPVTPLASLSSCPRCHPTRMVLTPVSPLSPCPGPPHSLPHSSPPTPALVPLPPRH